MEQNQLQESQAQRKKDAAADRFAAGCIMLLSVLLMGADAVLLHMELAQAGKMILFLILLDGLLIFYMKSAVMNGKLQPGRLPVAGGYLVSLMLVLVMSYYDIHNLWMFGPLLVAAMVDTSLGLIYDLIFVFLLANVAGDGIDQILYRFILCAILVVLARFLTEWKNLIYVGIIAISCNITLLLVRVSFLYRDSLSMDSLGELASTLFVLAVVFLINRRQKKPEAEPAPEPESVAEAVTEQTGNVFPVLEQTEQPKTETVQTPAVQVDRQAEQKAEGRLTAEERELLKQILEEDYPLMKRLREENPVLYHHSLKIGELSYVAAEMIEADAELARAGGYYHEIGRLVSSNYVKEGIRLAKEYSFPKPVIDIIKQHNIKVGQPVTVEAALVMISDSVIASLEYMKENQTGRISPDRLINGILDARLSGGSLDRSGITLAQYKVLKHFYANAVVTELEEIKAT